MTEPALTVVASAPEVVDQVLSIPVTEIEEGDRLRPVDPVHAEGLASVMGRDGQDTPIEICRLPGRTSWTLVTGAHRLAAAKLLGWGAIKAIVVTAEKAVRRRKEISENLFRRGLDPIDRAAFVAELYALEKAAAGLSADTAPQAAGANARWAKALKEQADDANDTMSFAYGFSERAAEQLGFNVRTLQRDLALHRGLPPHITDRLRGRPIAGNAGQLRALAKLPEAQQRAVVDLIVEGKAKGTTEALGILIQKPPADAEKKAWSALFGGWGRLSARRKRDALEELVRLGLPPGVKITFAKGGAHGA